MDADEIEITEQVLWLMALAEAMFDADRRDEGVALIDEAVAAIAGMGRRTLH